MRHDDQERHKKRGTGKTILQLNRTRESRLWVLGVFIAIAAAGGCSSGHAILEPYGKTFYLDGAGGWGFGRREVPEGLRRAGYRGDCEIFDWSATRNPLLDQMDPLGVNKLAARSLAHRIKGYKQKYPDNPVNIIALSAGTGVTTWALEHLKGEYMVNNVFFVGSSLAYAYDMDKALKSVEGRLHVYHSPRDMILPWVKLFGTVDGRVGSRVAGQHGLRLKDSYEGRVVNIGWEKKWERLGWSGGHTDCVGRSFVQYEIARRLKAKPRRATAKKTAKAADQSASQKSAPPG
jgi:hypothetical protein